MIKFVTHQNEYIAFLVKNDNDIVKTTSQNNELVFGESYSFDAVYVYEDADSKNNVYDYTVQLVGGKSFGLFEEGKESPINFNGLDLSKQFKLKIDKDKFSITVPKADEVHNLLFGSYKAENGEPIYLFDLCENDYFRLFVYSYNGNTKIDYKFHLVNKPGEVVGIDKVEPDKPDVDFESNNINEIEIDIDKIVIENGEIDFTGENDSINIDIDKIVVDNGEIDFAGDNDVTSVDISNVVINGSDIDFVGNNDKSKIDIDKVVVDSDKNIDFTS